MPSLWRAIVISDSQFSWWHLYAQHRFAFLLAVLIALLAGAPVLMGFGVSAKWFEALMSLLVLAAIFSLCVEPHQRSLAIVLGVPTVLLSLAGQTLPEGINYGVLFVGHLCEITFLFGAATFIVKSLFTTDTLSSDSIFGAVCGYLFLGLGWGVLYLLIEGFRPGSFNVASSLAPDGSARITQHVLSYYSFVTLTTVGYGDVTPLSATTRTLAWMEAVTGQFYLAVVVAGLVSIIATNKSRPSMASGDNGPPGD